jgi:hypothetical protein
MSEKTLKKRLAERRSVRDKTNPTTEVQPPTTATIDKDKSAFDRTTRLGSARNMANKVCDRFHLSQETSIFVVQVAWPFKKLMKRSVTYDELNFPQDQLNAAKAKSKQKTLNKVAEHSKSTTNAAATALSTIQRAERGDEADYSTNQQQAEVAMRTYSCQSLASDKSKRCNNSYINYQFIHMSIILFV